MNPARVTEARARLSALCLSALLAGCASPPKPPTDQTVSVGNWTLSLGSNGTSCTVFARDNAERQKTLNLRMRPPCGPVTDFRGTPQIHGYVDVGADVVVYVGELERGCGRVARGVLIGSTWVSVSPRIAHGPVKCVSDGMDEREFWRFAHPD